MKIYRNIVSIAVFKNTTSTWRKSCWKDDVYITVRLTKLLTWIAKPESVRQLVRHTLASYPSAAVIQCTLGHSEVSGRQKKSPCKIERRSSAKTLVKIDWQKLTLLTATSVAITLPHIWLQKERKLWWQIHFCISVRLNNLKQKI